MIDGEGVSDLKRLIFMMSMIELVRQLKSWMWLAICLPENVIAMLIWYDTLTCITEDIWLILLMYLLAERYICRVVCMLDVSLDVLHVRLCMLINGHACGERSHISFLVRDFLASCLLPACITNGVIDSRMGLVVCTTSHGLVGYSKIWGRWEILEQIIRLISLNWGEMSIQFVSLMCHYIVYSTRPSDDRCFFLRR